MTSHCADLKINTAAAGGLPGAPFGVPVAEPRHRHWLGDEKSLRDIAAERGQARPRRPVLDAFGDDIQAEMMSEIDRRVHDRIGAVIAIDRAYERLVNLDGMDRESLQVAGPSPA